MFRTIIAAAALFCLPGCATAQLVADPVENVSVISPDTGPPPEVAERAEDSVARAWRAYVTIRKYVEMVVPYLSPARAMNVRAIEGIIEGAFARAAKSDNLDVKAKELERATQGAAKLEELTSDPD